MIQHGAPLANRVDAALTEAVASADLDALPGRLRMLCTHAIKLTVAPWKVLRGGQAVACSDSVNRIADGLEESRPAAARQPRAHGSRRAVQ